MIILIEKYKINILQIVIFVVINFSNIFAIDVDINERNYLNLNHNKYDYSFIEYNIIKYNLVDSLFIFNQPYRISSIKKHIATDKLEKKLIINSDLGFSLKPGLHYNFRNNKIHSNLLIGPELSDDKTT